MKSTNNQCIVEPVEIVNRVNGHYAHNIVDFAGLTIGQQRELAREQWELRNEQRRLKRGTEPEIDSEYDAYDVIDALRSGVFFD